MITLLPAIDSLEQAVGLSVLISFGLIAAIWAIVGLIMLVKVILFHRRLRRESRRRHAMPPGGWPL